MVHLVREDEKSGVTVHFVVSRIEKRFRIFRRTSRNALCGYNPYANSFLSTSVYIPGISYSHFCVRCVKATYMLVSEALLATYEYLPPRPIVFSVAHLIVLLAFFLLFFFLSVCYCRFSYPCSIIVGFVSSRQSFLITWTVSSKYIVELIPINFTEIVVTGLIIPL